MHQDVKTISSVICVVGSSAQKRRPGLEAQGPAGKCHVEETASVWEFAAELRVVPIIPPIPLHMFSAAPPTKERADLGVATAHDGEPDGIS